jgi:hypothetical protein
MKKTILFVLVLALCMVTEQSKADFTFGEPTEVPNVNSSSRDLKPSVSADGLSLFFTSFRPGGIGGMDIWVTTRETTDDDWGEPVNLGSPVNSTAWETGSISYDGLSLYLSSTRSRGSNANADIWVTTRDTIHSEWGNPMNLGSTVNSSVDQCYTSISADELELYFSSNRGNGYGAYDLWVTRRETILDSWGTPENLGPTINSSAYEVDPGISPDGRILFFTSDRSGGYGGDTDIWMARRATTDDDWSEPVNLGSTINSSAAEDWPNVSADGSILYFRYSQSGRYSGGDIWQAPIIPIVDFNSDGFVDDGDLDILNSYLDTNETLCDIGPMPWGDGIVDEADIDVLMSYWGQEILLPPELIKWSCIVDDFEDYTDTEPDTIYLTWVDGYGDPANGATVGHSFPLAPGEHYVETTIVHNGSQSMPFFYDNTEAFISEATREWEVPQDWTKEGVSELGLWFRGYPARGSFTEGPAGAYTMSGSGADIWNNSDAFHFACKQLSGAGSIIAKVESVDQTDVWAKAGVMIRETLNANSKHAMMIITPAMGVSFQRRTSTGGASYETTRAGITAPKWVKIERTSIGRGTASNIFKAYYSGDGNSWTELGTVNISMSDTVYIGLAVTSHNSGAMCEAVFSNVSIEGHVSQETWTNQDIGITSNVAEPMYVALNGNAAIYHDDPNAAVIDDWTLWRIDLQEFADQDVNLAGVNSMTIGFGDEENTTAGGDGLVFFDYIGLR